VQEYLNQLGSPKKWVNNTLSRTLNEDLSNLPQALRVVQQRAKNRSAKQGNKGPLHAYQAVKKKSPAAAAGLYQGYQKAKATQAAKGTYLQARGLK
jgi:hypothetical protein